ncbi:hypothetical protein QVD17_28995 [Tagetes erecta]|uniref:Uncharacterized protein n=1 Tax=Tagetes erecta TaxID=13708 RepID=A0AAD8NT72_TARER|nr:hypothetical protein QVD17_28995 [Tagetes erecta]
MLAKLNRIQHKEKSPFEERETTVAEKRVLMLHISYRLVGIPPPSPPLAARPPLKLQPPSPDPPPCQVSPPTVTLLLKPKQMPKLTPQHSPIPKPLPKRAPLASSSASTPTLLPTSLPRHNPFAKMLCLSQFRFGLQICSTKTF